MPSLDSRVLASHFLRAGTPAITMQAIPISLTLSFKPSGSEMPMPTGRVKWFSLEKGFGFISNDEGEDVYLV